MGPEVAVRVRGPLAVPVRVEAGQRAEDPARGMRDQDRVLVVAERPVVAQEVQQVRHLLQVRGDVRPVAEQVRVVELQVDDVLDVRAVAVEVTALRLLDGRGGAGARACDTAGCDSRERERNRDRACDLQAFAHALLLLYDRETLRFSDPKWESDIWQSCIGVETALGTPTAGRNPCARTSARASARTPPAPSRRRARALNAARPRRRVAPRSVAGWGRAA